MTKTICKYCQGLGNYDLCQKCNGYGYILIGEQKPFKLKIHGYHNKPNTYHLKDSNFNT